MTDEGWLTIPFQNLVIAPTMAIPITGPRPSQQRPGSNMALMDITMGSNLVATDTIFYNLPASTYSYNTAPVSYSNGSVIQMHTRHRSYHDESNGISGEQQILANLVIGTTTFLPNEYILICDGLPHSFAVYGLRSLIEGNTRYPYHSIIIEYQCTPLSRLELRNRFTIAPSMPALITTTIYDSDREAGVELQQVYPNDQVVMRPTPSLPEAPTPSNVAAPPPFNVSDTSDDSNDPPNRCIAPPSSSMYGSGGAYNLKDPSNRRLLTAACDSSLEKKRSLCTHLLVPVLNNFYKQNPSLKPVAPPKPIYEYDTSNSTCRLCNPDNDD